ncbi:MAG: sigma-70 family RNA polymerase sigma factor [Acidobacteria bacterium]|nr:sigma-70 family RNA polymerase sigma factor [Acidobacteriota bacterium]
MAEDVTKLLLDWSNGEKSAVDRLLPIVYNELRRVAANLIRNERDDHTLQPTALVHEAYLKLIGQEDVKWDSRVQFFAFSARVMRNILVDHARTRLREKRGGNLQKISLDELVSASGEKSKELVALDDALTELAKFDERKSRIIELRYFGGLSLEEIEKVLKISAATIRRDMRFAEAWLYKQMAA